MDMFYASPLWRATNENLAELVKAIKGNTQALQDIQNRLASIDVELANIRDVIGGTNPINPAMYDPTKY